MDPFPDSLGGRLRYLKRHFYEVRDNQAPMDHSASYIAARLLENMFIWFPSPLWKEKSIWVRGLNVVVVFAVFFMWALILMHVLLNFESLGLVKASEGVGMGIGGVINGISMFLMFKNRALMTHVLYTVDKKVVSVPEAYRSLFRERFLVQFKFMVTLCFFGGIQGLPPLLYMLTTGRMYYETLTDLGESYSWSWWLQVLYQTWNCTVSGLEFSLKEFSWVCLYYEISILVEIQAKIAEGLWNGEHWDQEGEYKRLVGVIKEVTELKDLLDNFEEITSAYLLFWSFTIYIMIVLPSVAILIKKQSVNVVLAFFQTALFPLYVLALFSVWCFVGQRITSSFEQVDQALYDCNWPASDSRARKVILIFRMRLQAAVHIIGWPYFIVNWESFGDILKKCYYFLTLIMDQVNA